MTAARANSATLETTQDAQSSSMTAQAKSPTTEMLDKLEAAELHVSLFGNSTELLPWLRAAQGRFELPREVLAVAARGLHLSQLQQAHSAARPAPHQAGDVIAILEGSTPDEIMDADAAAAVAKARHERAGELLIAAGSRLAGESGGAFKPHRDALLEGPLRKAVAALLAEAADLAGQLRKYPGFSEAALLANGSPKELAAWRSSRELQANFALLLAAWRASWSAATVKGGTVSRDYLPQRPGRYYAWLDPDAVTPEALALGHDVEVLRVASASSAYQLLSPGEFQPLIDRVTAGLAQNAPQPASWIIRHGVASGA